MPEKTIPPLTPRQFLLAAREILGDSYFTRLFGVTLRTLQRWCAMKPYVDEDSVRDNYVEKHERILESLLASGNNEVARSIVARHAHIVGCELQSLNKVEPDLSSIEEECLDDYPALTKFHDAIRRGRPCEEIVHFWQEAKKELDETLKLYNTLNNSEFNTNG